ncbi:Hypothetical predicted protein, partial [Paramuricea clavata]
RINKFVERWRNGKNRGYGRATQSEHKLSGWLTHGLNRYQRPDLSMKLRISKAFECGSRDLAKPEIKEKVSDDNEASCDL